MAKRALRGIFARSMAFARSASVWAKSRTAHFRRSSNAMLLRANPRRASASEHRMRPRTTALACSRVIRATSRRSARLGNAWVAFPRIVRLSTWDVKLGRAIQRVVCAAEHPRRLVPSARQALRNAKWANVTRKATALGRRRRMEPRATITIHAPKRISVWLALVRVGPRWRIAPRTCTQALKRVPVDGRLVVIGNAACR